MSPSQVMYNPRSGEQVPCAVFVCPTYYQRLKHMVKDKVGQKGVLGEGSRGAAPVLIKLLLLARRPKQ